MMFPLVSVIFALVCPMRKKKRFEISSNFFALKTSVSKMSLKCIGLRAERTKVAVLLQDDKRN